MAECPLDLHGRPLGVLRLSLTARCNLACPYCCPDTEDPPGLLTLPERLALVEATVGLGVHTLRLTGGEPLLHRGLEELIAALQPLRRREPGDPRGALREIALTSNGVLLGAERARQLKAAGLDRITLSLDGTDGASVARMAGLGGAAAGGAVLEKVLAAIRHAREAGFDPARGQLKLNAVITRSGNADQLLPLAALAREQGLELRLIEFMDVGNRNGWEPEQVLPAAEMVARIGAAWPLEPVGRAPHGTASRWRYCDGGGGPGAHLGVVASITAPFCGDCNRLRITADGRAFTCLFAATGLDLRPWLRPHPDPAALEAALRGLWRERRDRWSEERASLSAAAAVSGARHAEMAYLGG
ncbi:MAG: radical SAM protein [Cyanobium sp. CZS 25K]|nr:radical SAM protein [Cyanobium sp. CZS25K]